MKSLWSRPMGSVAVGGTKPNRKMRSQARRQSLRSSRNRVGRICRRNLSSRRRSRRSARESSVFGEESPESDDDTRYGSRAAATSRREFGVDDGDRRRRAIGEPAVPPVSEDLEPATSLLPEFGAKQDQSRTGRFGQRIGDWYQTHSPSWRVRFKTRSACRTPTRPLSPPTWSPKPLPPIRRSTARSNVTRQRSSTLLQARQCFLLWPRSWSKGTGCHSRTWRPFSRSTTEPATASPAS